LTIGGKDFDGSVAVSVTTEDLRVYTKEAVDNAFVKNTQVATASTAGLVKVDGTTVTITSDGTISAKQAVSASANNDGLMSYAHFSKLEGIEEEANKTVVDTSLSETSTNPVQNKVVKSIIDTKVDKIDGKGLSTNDFTTVEKEKLARLENFSLNPANALTLGGVKVGKNIDVAEDGTISVADAVTYDVATPTTNGLMSTDDKKKIDALDETYATKTEVQNLATDDSFVASVTQAILDNTTPTTLNIYAVAFDVGEGKGYMAPQVVIGSSYTLPDLEDSTGYEFEGWKSSNEEDAQMIEGNSIELTSNITLYASWKLVSSSPDPEPEPDNPENPGENSQEPESDPEDPLA
jgi:hypothetical protein